MKNQELGIVLVDLIKWLAGNDNPEDFRDYVVMLFLVKRIFDLYDEECDTLIQEQINSGLSEQEAITYAANHHNHVSYCIPKEISWSTLSHSRQISGGHIDHILFTIEDINPCLHEVLTSVSFSPLEDERLNALIHQITKLNLGDKAIDSTKTLEEAYQTVLSFFANSVKNGNYYYAPAQVGRMVAEILNVESNKSVYDPTAGFGNMLFHVREQQHTQSSSLKICGQERNKQAWLSCKIRTLLAATTNDEIHRSDSLLAPLISDHKLRKFDYVVSNPPFALKDWGAWKLEHDQYHRFPYGLPTQQCGDYAFVQHALSSLNDRGRAAIILPFSALSRNTKDKGIRKGLIQDDLIEAVIGLPSNIFYNTSLYSCILIINKDKPIKSTGKVLFIDAIEEYVRGNNQTIMNDQHSQKIVMAYRNFVDEGSFCRVVENSVLIANNGNLHVREYINNSKSESRIEEVLNNQSNLNTVSFSDNGLVLSIVKCTKEKPYESIDNALYIPTSLAKPTKTSLNIADSHHQYIQVALNPERLINEYAHIFFTSEIGRLILGQQTEISLIPKLSIVNIKQLRIMLPDIEVQEDAIRTTRKLHKLSEFITDNQAELSTNLVNCSHIEVGADRLMESLADLSEQESLRRLIEKGESVTLEFKQVLALDLESYRKELNEGNKPKKKDKAIHAVLKTIVAFLNTNGGTLLIGVNDKGKITGVDDELKVFDHSSIDKFNLRLEQLLNNNIGQECIPLRAVSFITIDGKIVVKVEITPSHHPFFVKNTDFYVRNLASSEALTGNELVKYFGNHFNMRQQ